jgi:hypothetical protein
MSKETRNWAFFSWQFRLTGNSGHVIMYYTEKHGA